MRKLALITAILFTLMLACSLPSAEEIPSIEVVSPDDSSQSGPAPTADAGSGGSVAAAPTATLAPTPTPIPSEPVSIREGLSSLNSYNFVVETTSYTNTVDSRSIIRVETQHNSDLDATAVHYWVYMTADAEAEQMDSYMYTIGYETCGGSDADGWDYSTVTAQEKEMQDILSGMLDLLPLIDDPVYVGAETMNGVPSNHFTFQVSGIGAESGVDVLINQGEYWLAQDGQYLLRYTLVLETRDPVTQDLMHIDFLIDLNQINEPISIVFPAGCVP